MTGVFPMVALSASLTRVRSGRCARAVRISALSIVFKVAFFACGIRARRTLRSRAPAAS
jgi:hypothetical protein